MACTTGIHPRDTEQGIDEAFCCMQGYNSAVLNLGPEHMFEKGIQGVSDDMIDESDQIEIHALRAQLCPEMSNMHLACFVSPPNAQNQRDCHS